MSYISQIVELIKNAQEIASRHGFKNLLQPGLVKELIIADRLGHEVHRTKHEPDAYDPQNPAKKNTNTYRVLKKEPFNLTECLKPRLING